MSERPDPFDEGRRRSEARREELDELRADVEALVEEEVRRVGMSTGDVERMVREAVARELRRSAPAAAPWRTPALVAGAVVVGLVLGALGWRATGGAAGAGLFASGDAPAAEGADPRAAPDASGTRGATAGPEGSGESVRAAGDGDELSPARRAALYDSLFDGRAERLATLVDRLEAAGPAPPVAEAAAAWRAGEALGPGPRRRLHDGLVQLVLNEESGADLALDGFVTRGPCSGQSCGALLALWRERGDALGMPPLPADAAADTETLGVAERVLLLGALERDGGGSGG